MRCAMLLYTTLKTIEALPGAHGAGVWRLVVHKIVERPEVKCGIGSKRRQLGVDAFDLGAGVFDQEGGKLGVDTQQVVSNYQPLGSMLQLLLRVWDSFFCKGPRGVSPANDANHGRSMPGMRAELSSKPRQTSQIMC